MSAALWILAGALIGAAAFRARGSAWFERLTGRGATTARLAYAAVMGGFAWATGMPWPEAALTGLGFFLGAIAGWPRCLSLGTNPETAERDGPVAGQYVRHVLRGLLWPLPAAVLPGLSMAAAGWALGWPFWSLEHWRPWILLAGSGLLCTPAYHLGKVLDRAMASAGPGWVPRMTVIGELGTGAAMGAALGARVLFGLLLLVLMARAGPATAHEAPGGWTYDRDCCHSIDCAPVPDGAVREVAGGYRVRLRAGQHPMLSPGIEVDVFVPHGDRRIRVSGDSDRHACITWAGTVLCIYVPPGGV